MAGWIDLVVSLSPLSANHLHRSELAPSHGLQALQSGVGKRSPMGEYDHDSLFLVTTHPNGNPWHDKQNRRLSRLLPIVRAVRMPEVPERLKPHQR